MTEVMGFHRGVSTHASTRRHGYRLHAQRFTDRELLYSRAGYSRPGFDRPRVLAHGEALSPPCGGDGLAHAGFTLSVTSPRFTATRCGAERRGVIRSRFRGRLTVGPSAPTLVAVADCTTPYNRMTQTTSGGGTSPATGGSCIEERTRFLPQLKPWVSALFNL